MKTYQDTAFRSCSAIVQVHQLSCPAAAFLVIAFLVIAVLSNTITAEEIVKTKSSGPVTVNTRLAPSEPTIGDEVNLVIEVASEKGVEVLMPEFGEALERYSIVDFVPRNRIEADGSSVQSQKYTLQPFISGPQSIPPILIEFVDNRPGKKSSPDDFDAYEILTERIDFKVQSVVDDETTAALKPALGALELEREPRVSAVGLAAMLVSAGLVAVVGWFYWLRGRKRARRINSYEIAYQELQRLIDDRKSPRPRLSIEQFFVRISDIVRRYLEDRFELRAPELTTDEFLQLAAAESELSREHQGLLSEFLKQADVVKFAGVQATIEDVQRSSDLAMRFIEETRENAPDIELDESSSTQTLAVQDRKQVPADV